MATTKKDGQPELVMAKQGAYLGEEVGHVRKGEAFPADHPLVEKYPDLFESPALRWRTT